MATELSSAHSLLLPALEEGQSYPLISPIRRRKLVDDVYEGLIEAIVTGKLTSGQDLNELALARAMSVSRTPVHEAVLRLIADGLAEQRPNGRARVVRFTRGHIVSIYEMRKILESAASSLAAQRLDSGVFTQLRAEASALESAPKNGAWMQRAVKWDLKLHADIADASGNAYLRQEILRFRRLVQGFCRVTGTVEILQEAFREHLQILDRLEAKDSAGASLAMVKHIEKRVETVLNVFDRAEGGRRPESSIPIRD